MPHFSGKDGAVFLASLLIAALIWLISNLSRSYSGTVSVPVVAECNIEGHADRSAGAATVVARCHTSGFSLLKNRFGRGRKSVLLRVERQDMRHASGDDFYLCTPALAGYATEIFGAETSVDVFLTDTLHFLFPVQSHKRVPVELVHDVIYRPQYMSSAPMRLEPDSVTVYGETARLESMERILTAPLYLTDVHENLHGTLKLSCPRGIRLSDSEVSYSLTVARYVELQATVPVEVRNAPVGRSLQIYPSVADVTFRCLFPVSRDPSETFRLYVDYDDFSRSLNGRCIPRAQGLPTGLIDYRVSPEVFDCILNEP